MSRCCRPRHRRRTIFLSERLPRRGALVSPDPASDTRLRAERLLKRVSGSRPGPQLGGRKIAPATRIVRLQGEKKDIYRQVTSMPSLATGRGDRTWPSACSQSLERLLQKLGCSTANRRVTRALVECARTLVPPVWRTVRESARLDAMASCCAP